MPWFQRKWKHGIKENLMRWNNRAGRSVVLAKAQFMAHLFVCKKKSDYFEETFFWLGRDVFFACHVVSVARYQIFTHLLGSGSLWRKIPKVQKQSWGLTPLVLGVDAGALIFDVNMQKHNPNFCCMQMPSVIKVHVENTLGIAKQYVTLSVWPQIDSYRTKCPLIYHEWNDPFR